MSNDRVKPKKSTPRVGSFRDRQSALGRTRRDPYLTDEEWVIIKAKITELRKSDSI